MADINVGLLFLLAITSIGVYGIILGGWASNNKYSLLGGLRSAAQLVSYEVPMGLALVVGAPDDALALARRDRAAPGGARTSGSSSRAWSRSSSTSSSGVAETNRNPFDLPEAESELVSGFNTEYSGVKFAFFFLGEYTAMIIISCVAVTVFFGGWLRAVPEREGARVPRPRAAGGLVPRRRSAVFLFGYIWFRSTFPRYRFDQLMALGWKWLIPLALANIVVVAFAILALPGPDDGPGRGSRGSSAASSS